MALLENVESRQTTLSVRLQSSSTWGAALHRSNRLFQRAASAGRAL